MHSEYTFKKSVSHARGKDKLSFSFSLEKLFYKVVELCQIIHNHVAKRGSYYRGN